MRRLCAIACLLTSLCGSAGAQDVFTKPQRSGYFFVAPGKISVNVPYFSEPSFQIGGGYEGFIYRGLGIGIDGGALYVADPQATKHWATVVSPYLTYDFQRSATQKVSPFVAGGLIFASSFNVCCGYSFGGGIKYWFSKHYGLRFEFRDNARVGQLNTYHDIQGRIGLAIR